MEPEVHKIKDAPSEKKSSHCVVFFLIFSVVVVVLANSIKLDISNFPVRI